MKILAVMEQTDAGGVDLGFVLFCVGVMVVVAMMGFVPVRTARVRGSRWAEGILAGVVLWGVLMAGSVIYAEMERQQYEKERTLNMMQGYFDPAQASQEPAWPWGVWAGLLVAYGGLVVAARAGREKGKG